MNIAEAYEANNITYNEKSVKFDEVGAEGYRKEGFRTTRSWQIPSERGLYQFSCVTEQYQYFGGMTEDHYPSEINLNGKRVLPTLATTKLTGRYAYWLNCLAKEGKLVETLGKLVDTYNAKGLDGLLFHLPYG